MLGVTPSDDVEEGVLQVTGDRAWLASADGAIIHLADRRQLSGRAGHEHLVGDVELVAGEPFFHHGQTALAADLHDRVAGDPFEDRGQRRGLHDAVAHEEDVLPRTFGDVALGVQQDRLVVPAGFHFALGHDGIDVVPGDLGPCHADVDVVPGEGGHLGPDAVLQAFLAEVGAPRPGRDRYPDRVLGHVEPHVAGAHEDDGPDVAFMEPVHADGLPDRVCDFLLPVWNLQQADVGRRKQPVHVLVEAKDGRALRAFVAPDAFESGQAIVEAVREDVDLGVFPGHELPVQPDLFGFLQHERMIAAGPDLVKRLSATRRLASLCPSTYTASHTV